MMFDRSAELNWPGKWAGPQCQKVMRFCYHSFTYRYRTTRVHFVRVMDIPHHMASIVPRNPFSNEAACNGEEPFANSLERALRGIRNHRCSSERSCIRPSVSSRHGAYGYIISAPQQEAQVNAAGNGLRRTPGECPHLKI